MKPRNQRTDTKASKVEQIGDSRAKSSRKAFLGSFEKSCKFFQKPLDKYIPMWYNTYVGWERTAHSV
jgi:hypothetical protein